MEARITICRNCSRSLYFGTIYWRHYHNQSTFCQKSGSDTRSADPMLDTGLTAIQTLIDLALADNLGEEVEANLHSARLHIVRAIEEVERGKVGA